MTFEPLTTALDPAGPWFSVSDDGNSVHKTDANLVDVIHTNSGPIYQVRREMQIVKQLKGQSYK